MLRCLLVFVALGCASRLIAADPPNVVLFLIDDLGQRDIACYGSRYYRTPHIDKLASQGVRYTDAYAACPVCSPTRCALLTGQYPQRHGITDWLPGRPDRPDQKLKRPVPTMQLAHEAVTLADALKAAGYTTGHIGKWHLGGEGFDPTKNGFDVNIAGDHTGTPMSYFAPYRNKKGQMPGLDKAPDGEYLTDRLAAEAVKFISANRSKPFFLYLPHYAVHTPMRAKQALIDQYQPGRPGTQGNPTYAAMVQSMDEAVGTVLKALDDQNLSSKTLVIFTSDNGGLATLEGMPQAPTYNGPLREGKGYLYEGGIRVPLIIRGPDFPANQTSATPVCSIDLFPTILEVCGVKTRAKLDGVSLHPRSPIPTRELYWHYPHYANQGSRPGGAVRAGNWKLVEFYESNRRELYDLSKDISETRNLAAEKPDVVNDLAAKLDTWRTTVGAKMPTPNPDYRPNPQAADGTVLLHARTADVHGTQLRFEPLPHKNTLGFWTQTQDYASWDFEITKPGSFKLEVLQGCGKGSGGSEVEVAIGTEKVSFVVQETGGFQTFVNRDIGTATIAKPGRHTLSVKAVKKPGPAVMDVRQMRLVPTTTK